MDATLERLEELGEAEVAIANRPQADSISSAIGSSAYSAKHRFSELTLPVTTSFDATSPALTVSRFYFTAQVVVDIVPERRRVPREVEAKRAFCRERGLRYVLISDPYDDAAVRQQLQEAAAGPVSADTPARRKPAAQKRPKTRAAAAA